MNLLDMFLKLKNGDNTELDTHVVYEAFNLYDHHFAAMFCLDYLITEMFDIRCEEDIDDVLIPKLVELGIYPVDESGNPVYDRDTFVKYCNLPMKHSVYFAVERLRIFVSNKEEK